MQRNTEELLTFIFDSIGQIAKKNDNKSVLRALAKMGRDIVFADRCTIWILDTQKKSLWTEVAHGVEKLSVEPFSGIVGAAVQSGESIIVNNVYEDKRFNPTIDEETGYKTKTMMVIPMRDAKNQVVGAIQVINKLGDKHFDSEDLTYLKLASTYVSETIKSIFLLEEIDATQREIIHIVGIVGENRSQETAYHVKRVSEYAYLLAKLYGLSEKEAILVRDASPLHDIGKIAIPDVILNKPGKYNDEERKKMMQHAILGYEMLKHSERGLLQAAATIAHEHHEKWDGTGYPRGLKGQDIHLYGRIVSLADIFDALSCERIYKKGWEHKKVIAYLKQEKGKFFEPKLVELLLENEEKFIAIKERFKDDFLEANSPCHIFEEDSCKIEVLGAYGTKSQTGGSSAFLIDEKTTIDAGNLIIPLGEKCVNLESVWLTHSHLDHISDLAFIVDNYYERRKKPLHIYALPETIKILKRNIFNHSVWPDFSDIPLAGSKEMSLIYHAIQYEKMYRINENLFLEPIETDHTVPSCGYVVHKDNKSLLITADTLSMDTIVERLNNDDKISTLVVECSFPSTMEKLAKESKHLTVKWLFEALERVNNKELKIYINHIKPEYKTSIVSEIESLKKDWSIVILGDGDTIVF